jgi:hypothetical protein
LIASRPSHRLHALERLLVTAELIASARFGVPTLEVNRAVADRFGRAYCVRTTTRDVMLLAQLGYIERRGYRWRAVRPIVAKSE